MPRALVPILVLLLVCAGLVLWKSRRASSPAPRPPPLIGLWEVDTQATRDAFLESAPGEELPDWAERIQSGEVRLDLRENGEFIMVMNLDAALFQAEIRGSWKPEADGLTLAVEQVGPNEVPEEKQTRERLTRRGPYLAVMRPQGELLLARTSD